MQLHTLTSTHKHRPKKRVGRGGKRGTTSGGGDKGQRKRSGHRIRPAERELILRLPKLRGVKNKPMTPAAVVMNLRDLERIAKKLGAPVITRDALVKAHVMHRNDRVKVLGAGELKMKVTVQGIPVSKSAKAAIEKAGGKVE